MTKGDVQAFVRSVHAHAQDFGDAVMLHWLDELEQKVACEIYDQIPEEGVTEPGTDDVLSVPTPYNKIYWIYLLAMMELVRGACENYEFINGIFKEAWGDYARFVQRLCGSGKQGKKGGETV